MRAEAAGGAVLILAGAVAMIWANSPASASYARGIALSLGGHPLTFWINDGLMAIFFLLVGLELRREITEGELATPAQLAAPAIAALGGMLVPAIIFSAFNYADRFAMRGWAVPVATDIAFALAVLRVLGAAVPVALTVFLTALAIIDDLGAIIVIALFYSNNLHAELFGAAVLVLLLLAGLSRIGVRSLWVYLAGGVLLWALVLGSGVHATLAGVALAFVIPSRRTPRPETGPVSPQADQPSPAHRLEHALQPVVSFLVLPLFGLANAGLPLDKVGHGVWREQLPVGTALALVLGKQIGVFGSLMVARRLRLVRLPAMVNTVQLYGASILCGIGFTMSLFIADLAYGDAPQEDQAKLAVFAASVVSALIGLLVIALGTRRRHPTAAEQAAG